MTADDLKTMQAWSLERKIRVSQTRIMEAVERWNGNAIVSFSGGKDSTVLIDLARRCYPDIKAVFVDTGLEFPEIVDFVGTFDNVDIIRPRLCGDSCVGDCRDGCFGKIVREVGWNFPSKDVAHAMYYARQGKQWALNYFQGLNSDGTESWFKQRYKKWAFLIDAPFLLSTKCCALLKERPLDYYHKQHGKALPIVGVMAAESVRRKTAWLKTGCNAFESRKPMSKPLSFWTEQDILRYIKEFNIKIADCYGDIVEDKKGRLHTTGESRTGCILCPVGCHLDKENKFVRLQKTHPEIWERGVRLGLTDVLDYVGVSY